MKSWVWIVEQGEDCEGGRIISVHANYSDAIRAATAYMKSEGSMWSVEHAEPHRWSWGFDWLTVSKYLVRN